MDSAAGFTPLIAVHALAAAYVLLLGPVNVFRRQRDRVHRTIGYTWVAVMVITCLSSFGIFGAEGFSLLHGLSAYTLFSVGAGIWSVMRGNRLAHRYNMVGAYLGTLVAFLFAAAVPSRRIPQLALDDPASLLLIAVLVLLTSSGYLLLLFRRDARQAGTPARS
jgi:uncharacterized membrane protein